MTELARRQMHAPDADSYAAIVGELEQVERAARERRLAAESEAERIREAAAEEAAGIAASVPARIATALAELRSRHLAAAGVEVAAIEAGLVADHEAGGTRPDPVIDTAVELLVAAVLAEPSG